MLKGAVALASLWILFSTVSYGAPAQKHDPWGKYHPQPPSAWTYPVTIGNPDGSNNHEASCASVTKDRTVTYWILGFWTGMNSATLGQVGLGTDTAGLLAEVKLYCDAHPSDSILQAAGVTYEKLRVEGK